MDEGTPPSKLTATKQRWAAEGRFLTGRHARPEAERLPPGQHLVRTWPVLDLGQEPEVPLGLWRLDVTGLVGQRLSLDWAAFGALPQGDSRSDIHCVTTWSRYDNDWRGVATRDLIAAARPAAEAGAVWLTCHDGYTTNLTLVDFAAPDAILATHWQGKPLAREHGGPMRGDPWAEERYSEH